MNYLIHPINKKKIKLFSLQGKQLLKQYIKIFFGGIEPCKTQSKITGNKDEYNNKIVKKIKDKEQIYSADEEEEPAGGKKKYSILIGAGNINKQTNIINYIDCGRARDAKIDICITIDETFVNEDETNPYALLLDLTQPKDLNFLYTHFKNKIDKIIFDRSTIKFFLLSDIESSLDKNPTFSHYFFGFFKGHSNTTYQNQANAFKQLLIKDSTEMFVPDLNVGVESIIDINNGTENIIDNNVLKFVQKYVVIEDDSWYYNDKYNGFNVNSFVFKKGIKNIHANVEKKMEHNKKIFQLLGYKCINKIGTNDYPLTDDLMTHHFDNYHILKKSDNVGTFANVSDQTNASESVNYE